MSLFWSDSIAVCCSNVELTKKWWLHTFDCKEVKIPVTWDDPLPSDVALKFPGSDEPNVALCDKAEVEKAGYERPNDDMVLFCRKIDKAHDYLDAKGAAPGPIEDSGGTQHFDIRDPEGNVIEICKEP